MIPRWGTTLDFTHKTVHQVGHPELWQDVSWQGLTPCQCFMNLTELLLSTLAGLSTTLGGLLSTVVREPGPRFMSLMLGFSAGVMILVSFGELLPEGVEETGFPLAYLAFFGGMAVMFLIDMLIPHIHMGERHDAGAEARACPLPEPREGCGRHGRRHRDGWQGEVPTGRLLKTGLLVALAIGVHNFPEGITTFVGTVQEPALGIAIAVAIMLHNIPEGIAVSAPVYAATGSRGKALLWSALSGLAEPVGAVLAAAVWLPFLNAAVSTTSRPASSTGTTWPRSYTWTGWAAQPAAGWWSSR